GQGARWGIFRMVRKYFGTDRIRGRANGEITPELALKVGQAAGVTFRRGDHRHRVVVGKDTRLSGYMIETALVAGFTSVGMDVLLLGPIPTPAGAMLTRSMRADLGVMISASHNPYDDNGIKLFGPDDYKLSDEVATGVDPDGFNINRECGSTAPDPLCRKVREMRADIGIALDGDADRVVIADEQGHIVDGDQLLAVIAESWSEDHLLTKPGIVGTVMYN